MKKREMTPAQREYIKFDHRRSVAIKCLIVWLVAILICLVAAFRAVDDNPTPLLLFLGVLIVYSIITVIICKYLARKHEKLYVAAYGNDPDIVRTGLFGELWQEFEWNQYEGLTDGKVVYAETHNNIIDLQIIRNKHEYLIEIDSEKLSMICDEESDDPIEKEIPLSEFKDVVEVFMAIRDFIENRKNDNGC